MKLVRAGIVTDEARTLAFSPRPALLDPHRDMGMFVTRERGGEPAAVTGQRNTAGAASEEMRKIMKDWGYAHDKADLSR